MEKKFVKSKYQQRCKEILRNSPKYQPLSKDDFDWLVNEVLKYHYKWDLYDSVGIEKIQPEHSKDHYNSLSFHVHLLNGSVYDISFLKAIERRAMFENDKMGGECNE